MKIRITENQYDLIRRYINEVRREPKPFPLKDFFNDNKGAQFFAVTQRTKGGSESDYDFKIGEVNGHMILNDINKNTKTKGCNADINLDTMIYGNQFKLRFGSCGDLTINNVVGVKLFKDENSLKSNNPMDTMEIEHEFDTSVDEFAKKYNDEIKSINIGDEAHFDLKINNKSIKYDGEVISKMGPNMQIEMFKPNTDEMLFSLYINISEDPFYVQDGELFFKSKSVKQDKTQQDFNANVIKFFIDAKQDSKKEEKPEDKKEENPEGEKIAGKTEDELRAEAKIAMDMILNDPLLKKAFFRQPSFFELFKAEFTGKKPLGKGIIPTLQIVGDYNKKQVDEKLNATFIDDKRVDYKLANDLEIPYKSQNENKIYKLEANKIYSVFVSKYKLGEDRKLVGYNDNQTKDEISYIIQILKLTDKENIYRCNFIKEGGDTIKDVLVELLPKNEPNYGYTPKPKEKQPAAQPAAQQTTQPKTA